MSRGISSDLIISSLLTLYSLEYFERSIGFPQMIKGPSFLIAMVYLNWATNSPFFSERIG